METGKTKVVIIQKVFSNYRKPIFDRLSQLLDLSVLHSKNSTGITQSKTSYSYFVKALKYAPKPTAIYLMVIRKLMSIRPHVIIHEFTPSLISLYTSFCYARLSGKRFIIWGHGYNRNIGLKPGSLKTKIRMFFMKRCDAILVYGKAAKTELSRFIGTEKIFVAQNTLDTDTQREIRDRLEKRGLDRVKEDLQINHAHNVVFVGRLLADKWPHLLFEVNDLLEPGLDIGFHFIGNGPELSAMKAIKAEKGLENFYFYGKIDDRELVGSYLFVSDLMIMPGYLGLAINHAFCFDTPVVSLKSTPEGPFHSPEIEYIEQNLTGFLGNNVEEIATFTKQYLTDVHLREKMIGHVRHCINNTASIQTMILGFEEAITHVSKP